VLSAEYYFCWVFVLFLAVDVTVFYQEEWIGKNWLGKLPKCHDNTEGVYTEVETSLGGFSWPPKLTQE